MKLIKRDSRYRSILRWAKTLRLKEATLSISSSASRLRTFLRARSSGASSQLKPSSWRWPETSRRPKPCDNSEATSSKASSWILNCASWATRRAWTRKWWVRSRWFRLRRRNFGSWSWRRRKWSKECRKQSLRVFSWRSSMPSRKNGRNFRKAKRASQLWVCLPVWKALAFLSPLNKATKHETAGSFQWAKFSPRKWWFLWAQFTLTRRRKKN